MTVPVRAFGPPVQETMAKDDAITSASFFIWVCWVEWSGEFPNLPNYTLPTGNSIRLKSDTGKIPSLPLLPNGITGDGTGTLEATRESIFMESVFKPSPREIGRLIGTELIQLRQFALRPDRFQIEERMVVIDLSMNLRGIDQLMAVQAHKVVFLVADLLQAVHPIMRGGKNAAITGLFDAIIPRSPAACGFGHETGIAVEGGRIRLIRELAEQPFLHGCGIGQQRMGLIPMACQNDFVVRSGRSVAGRDDGLVWRA